MTVSPLAMPSTYFSRGSSRATLPSSTSMRTAVAAKVFVMLAIRTLPSGSNGAPLAGSSTPATARHSSAPMVIHAAPPSMPVAANASLKVASSWLRVASSKVTGATLADVCAGLDALVTVPSTSGSADSDPHPTTTRPMNTRPTTGRWTPRRTRCSAVRCSAPPLIHVNGPSLMGRVPPGRRNTIGIVCPDPWSLSPRSWTAGVERPGRRCGQDDRQLMRPSGYSRASQSATPVARGPSSTALSARTDEQASTS